MTEERIPAALDGQRLDRVVSFLTGCSRADAAALLAAGAVVLDGRVVTVGKSRVAEGQTVTVDRDRLPGEARPVADPSVDVRVVYEDADVLVVDKQAGLVVHPGAGGETGTLVHGLLARYPDLADVGEPLRPGIVHRLDKDTTGLLVVARTPEAHAALVAQLAAREVERVYRTLVWGEPDAARGVIDAPLGRAGARTKIAVRVTGKEARTRYVVERTFRDPVRVSWLECRLETGRTHQIRVHLAAIGHPVVGDREYGGARPGLDAARPLLHAERLAFVHPRLGERVALASPLPEDLVAVLSELS